jgi:ribulose-5-phosphate 4-epimerase/fuculose-1-phosphate aldolase
MTLQHPFADSAAERALQMPGVPQPPLIGSASELRAYRKQRLAGAFRIFAKLGFDEGTAGHITARDPERQDCFWVNPFGVPFGHLKVSDLVLVDLRGDLVEGRRACNRAAFAIHSAIHRARPDVVSAAHAHSIYGKTWSSMGKLLQPLTQDDCAFYCDHTLYNAFNGVVYSTSEGERIADALGVNKAIILRNHGLLTVGSGVEEAVWWFIALERACQTQLVAAAAGKPHVIDASTAELTHHEIGTPYAAWLQFQALWEQISTAQPDLFD